MAIIYEEPRSFNIQKNEGQSLEALKQQDNLGRIIQLKLSFPLSYLTKLNTEELSETSGKIDNKIVKIFLITIVKFLENEINSHLSERHSSK